MLNRMLKFFIAPRILRNKNFIRLLSFGNNTRYGISTKFLISEMLLKFPIKSQKKN